MIHHMQFSFSHLTMILFRQLLFQIDSTVVNHQVLLFSHLIGQINSVAYSAAKKENIKK